MRSPRLRSSLPGTLLLALFLSSCFGGKGGGGGGGGATLSPAFQITVTHGNFNPGQQNATYTVTVINVGTEATAGNVQVTATIPAGETLVSMTGSGWSPSGALVSTRSDALANGQSYPPITVTVNVAANAASPQVMMVSVSGGGASTANAQDSSTIAPAALFISGRFAFLFTGFDKNGPVSVAGAFTVDSSGNVTGERDYKDPINTNAAEPITGFCQNGAIAQTGICVLKGTAASLINSTYDIVFRTSAQVARFVEDPADAPSTGSGVLIAQSAPPFTVATGGFNGSYAFGLVGTDSATPAKRLGVVGTITTNASGVITSGQGDFNDGGTLIQPVPPTALNVTGTLLGTATGDATKSDSFGRIKTASPGMVIGTALPLNLGIYIVGLNRAFAVDVTPVGQFSTQVLAGQFFSLANAPFSVASFNSPADVFDLWGVAPGGASNTTVGTMAPSAVAPNMLMDVNNNGVINGGAGLASPEAGTINNLSVAADGRTLFTIAAVANTNYVAYLDAANDAFILGGDSSVSFGFLTAQAGTLNFTNANIFGTYALGTFMPVSPTVQNVAGPITLTPGAANSGTFSVAGVVTGNYSFVPAKGRGIATTTAPAQNSVFYIITPGNIVLMGADAGAGSGDAMSYLQF